MGGKYVWSHDEWFEQYGFWRPCLVRHNLPCHVDDKKYCGFIHIVLSSLVGHERTAYRGFIFLKIILSRWVSASQWTNGYVLEGGHGGCLLEHNFVKVVRMNLPVFHANEIFHGARLQPFNLLLCLPKSKLFWNVVSALFNNHAPSCNCDSWFITVITMIPYFMTMTHVFSWIWNHHKSIWIYGLDTHIEKTIGNIARQSKQQMANFEILLTNSPWQKLGASQAACPGAFCNLELLPRHYQFLTCYNVGTVAAHLPAVARKHPHGQHGHHPRLVIQ